MAWTYFTTALDGTRPITQAERDELYDQLATKLGDCSENFSLNATDQTAIKDSRFITDRASLDDSDGPTNLVDRLEAVIAATEAAFSNYDDAVMAALTAAGISDTERDDILDAGMDDHRLWNYYKELIDALECGDEITVTTRFRAAMKEKCGWEEFGTPSSPPKFYLNKVLDGELSAFTFGGAGSGCTGPDYSCSFAEVSGNCSYDPATCSFTNAAVQRVYTYSDCEEDEDPATDITYNDCTAVPVTFATFDLVSETSTVRTYSADGFTSCEGRTLTLGTSTETLEDEFTLAVLEGVVDDALAAASWSSFGATIYNSFYTLGEDELNLAKQETEWKLSFDAVPAGKYLRYELWFAPPVGVPTIVSNHCVALSLGDTFYVVAVAPPTVAGSHVLLNYAISDTPC